jgi:hypothetical protein
VTINLFVQEDRSPSGTGRAQFQTHANEQRTPNGNVQATTNTTVDPNQLAPTHPHWAIWRGLIGPRQVAERTPMCRYGRFGGANA